MASEFKRGRVLVSYLTGSQQWHHITLDTLDSKLILIGAQQSPLRLASDVMDSDNNEVYEGDIVEAYVLRATYTGYKSSKADGRMMGRFTVTWKKGSLRMDGNNPFNKELLRLRGNEREPRMFHVHEALFEFAQWTTFKVIGNVDEQRYLLEAK